MTGLLLFSLVIGLLFGRVLLPALLAMAVALALPVVAVSWAAWQAMRPKHRG